MKENAEKEKNRSTGRRRCFRPELFKRFKMTTTYASIDEKQAQCTEIKELHVCSRSLHPKNRRSHTQVHKIVLAFDVL